MRMRAVAVIGLALAGSQAGHLLAYWLRFRQLAETMQSSGMHAYFPALVKLSLGAAAVALVMTLLMIGVARAVRAGARGRPQTGPSFLVLLACLFTAQLAAYMAQEMIEAAVAGVAADTTVSLLWGIVGQLPLALAGAVALRWLWTRVEDAAAVLGSITAPAAPIALQPAVAPAAVFSDVAAIRWSDARNHTTKRGPPISSF